MKRKKSKYKHITLNKKKFYFYRISWVDITGEVDKLLARVASASERVALLKKYYSTH